MSISLRAISRILSLQFLLSFALAAVLPLSADDGHGKGNDTNLVVLYEGPLVHEQIWTIKSGPVGPDNQMSGSFGGTCSMVSSDVSNLTGSGRERVTFEVERIGLGVWKMEWTDTLSGLASDGNRWHEYMVIDFSGTTADGKAPRPNRAFPSPGNDGFLQPVPSNVTADALDLSDFFILQPPVGAIAASSHVHWILRLQIPPAAMDPPPSFFPVVLFGQYIVNLHDQLAGQYGCDPL
jgi:hypothetical protein